jgi:lysozyme
MNCVEDLISKHEGRVPTVYRDSEGHPTIGIGHCLNNNPLPEGFTPPLTDTQIDALFASDLRVATDAVSQGVPFFYRLDPVRQAVLVDMAFNLGISTLLSFHHTLGCVEAGNYQAAADGMLDSLWARQVGPRAQEDAQMMVTGEWPNS